MNFKEQIKNLEDLFFDVNSPRYGDMNVFSEIFKIFDIPDFKEKQPDIYESELLRIRDLHNSFTYAYEEGYEKGKKYREGMIEIAKKMIMKGMDVPTVIEMTGLTHTEIDNLKE